jgi:hypothetical protein
MVQNYQFLRLLFPDARQERVAVRLLGALAAPLGDQVDQVRPNTTLEGISALAGAAGTGTVEFISALEDGIGMEADLLPDDFERMTVRDLVEYVCAKEHRTI